MSVMRSAPIPYGYGGVAYNYTQQHQADMQNEAYRRLQEQRYQESMAAQRAEQQYRNQALGINNANDVGQMQMQMAGLGLNFAGDDIQRQMQLANMSGDLARQQAYQRDAARNAGMDVARLKYGFTQQQLAAKEDLARTAYQRGTHEIQGDWERYRNAFRG